MSNFRIGILGATGAVGQRFIQLLQDHPWFRIHALFASDRSSGQSYREACTWRLPTPLPEPVAAMPVYPCEPRHASGLDLVFSALPSSSAKTIEPAFAKAGYPVISNAGAYRMAEDVPLLIPEVNPDHTRLIPIQQRNRNWSKGYIVTNPNCSTIGLVPPLKALQEAFGLDQVMVTTMQAVSGAGYPGPPLSEIGDNVLPFIRGEEEKIESEPKKLLGRFSAGRIIEAPVRLAAQANRVHVSDGHLEAVNFSLLEDAELEQVREVLRGFRGVPQQAGLPFAPEHPIVVMDEEDRPQPKKDRDLGKGMAVAVGRLRPCPLFHFRMMVLSHNTIRGAAGAAILNAELLVHQGFVA